MLPKATAAAQVNSTAAILAASAIGSLVGLKLGVEVTQVTPESPGVPLGTSTVSWQKMIDL
jgi:hypothetical protein